ncbi:MAG: vitamin B12 dependent-methionine synthase activation domain-containing protein, partial [Bdellovibrionota bacterium]
VGRLFNANQLIVAEVLQSAEAMKAAVAHLEQFMERAESSTRGKIILATVKGDVHDIGKNLVEIILSNNGFRVVNLGIKVPPEQLIAAVREHKPDIVGLSGLLVKSAQQMVLTAEDFAKAGVDTPVLVGGAALSSNFVDKQIARVYTTGTVAYASDAMSGLELAKTIVDPERFAKFKGELSDRRTKLKNAVASEGPAPAPATEVRSSTVPLLTELPKAPDLNRHVVKNAAIEQIWRYVNPLMLYGRHLGVKGGTVRKLETASGTSPEALKLRREIEQADPKAFSIWKAVQEVKDEYRGTEILQPSAVYQFFRASSEGNRLHLHGADGKTKLTSFEFPRQRKADGLCLSDYTRPLENGTEDTVAMFVVTCGKGIRQMAELLKNRGDYLKSHILQALALESAEAYAEMLHSQIRKAWGFPDAPEMTMMERFQAKYRGKRYSFGYPACPRLDDQALLWSILNPNEIGVQLTEGFMMDPESSVSALCFHHPAATYFSVGASGANQRGADDENLPS